MAGGGEAGSGERTGRGMYRVVYTSSIYREAGRAGDGRRGVGGTTGFG